LEVDAQEPFELENGILGLRHLDAAEIVWFAGPALTPPRTKCDCFRAPGSLALPKSELRPLRSEFQLTPGRVLVRLGYGPTKPRDYPRALCYAIEEFLVYTIAHELHHLTVSEYRGDLGALDAGDPDTLELTSAILNAIGTFDLEKMWRRMDLDTFNEERGRDVYALQRLRIWRRRGSP
jgi:hypothetical protein